MNSPASIPRDYHHLFWILKMHVFQFKTNQYLAIYRKMVQAANSLMATILLVKSQEVNIPSFSNNIFAYLFLDRIAHKWSKASGPGGMNVNASKSIR